MLKWLALLFLLVCLLWSDLVRLILGVFTGAVCLLVLSFAVVWVINYLSYGLVSDAFSVLDGVSRPPRPRLWCAGFVEGTGRTVSCVVSRFLVVAGVAGHVCMGTGRAVSCVISRLLVVAISARPPRALAWSSVSSVVTWLSGCLEKVNLGTASVSSSGMNMPGTFPAPVVIVVPDSLVRSLVSPISLPNAASQVVAKEASACPSKPTYENTFRPGRYYPQYRDRSVVSWGNSTEQVIASHSMPVSQESGNDMTSQTCVEVPGAPEPKALLLCEEGQPGVRTHRYAGNAAPGSPYKISVGKKSSTLRGVQWTRKSAPLVVTEALSVACNLSSMFELKVQQGEQVNDSDRNPEDEMDFEPTGAAVAPVDVEVLMQDALGPIDDGSSTDEMDWEPSTPRPSLVEEAFLVRNIGALSLASPKPNCIADKPASSGVIAEQSVSAGSEPALKKAVSTASQAPVEVNQGPHAPSATPKTVTVRKITLRVGGKKVPGKGESAVAKTPLPSTSVPPQAEVQTAAPTSGNGEGGSTSGNPPPPPTAPGPSANTASQPEQPSCESTGENGSTPAVTEPAAAANSPAPTAGPTTSGRELVSTRIS